MGRCQSLPPAARRRLDPQQRPGPSPGVAVGLLQERVPAECRRVAGLGDGSAGQGLGQELGPATKHPLALRAALAVLRALADDGGRRHLELRAGGRPRLRGVAAGVVADIDNLDAAQVALDHHCVARLAPVVGHLEAEVSQALGLGLAHAGRVDHALALGLLLGHGLGVGLLLAALGDAALDHRGDVVAVPRRQGQHFLDQLGLVLHLHQGGHVGHRQLAGVDRELGPLGQLEQGHVGADMLGAAAHLGRQSAHGAAEGHQPEVTRGPLGWTERSSVVVVLGQHDLDLLGLGQGRDHTRSDGQPAARAAVSRRSPAASR